jgi:hypothetical protein
MCNLPESSGNTMAILLPSGDHAGLVLSLPSTP